MNFFEIDLTRSSGWYDFYSIHVDSTKQFILKKQHSGETAQYFKGKLTDSVVEKIIALVDSINLTKYDTVYEPNCMDCSIYKIIIDTKARKLTTSVRGNYALAHLDSLVRVFTTISKLSTLESIDTTYNFESFNHFLPPVVATPSELINSIKGDK